MKNRTYDQSYVSVAIDLRWILVTGDGGSDALFGGNMSGTMSDKVPPFTQPNDEDNPMGDVRFRQMIMEMVRNP